MNSALRSVEVSWLEFYTKRCGGVICLNSAVRGVWRCHMLEFCTKRCGGVICLNSALRGVWRCHMLEFCTKRSVEVSYA